VVDISSEEEDATDIDWISVAPMRSASFQEQPSAQSLSSSLFSHDSKTHRPNNVHDVFDPLPGPSTNFPPSKHASLSQSVLHFARSPFGTDLEVMVIAHSGEAQKILDDHQIAWGVQWEIARGVCSGLWTWETVGSQVNRLKGKNSEAAFKVEKVMKGRDGSKPSDMHIWYVRPTFPALRSCGIFTGGNLTSSKMRS
jgi:hypothetical protein